MRLEATLDTPEGVRMPGHRTTDPHPPNSAGDVAPEVVVALLGRAQECWRHPARPVTPGEPLRVGVDLGTASCVLVVIDAEGQPIWLDTRGSGALKDGVVVDFARASATVRELRDRAEAVLGVSLPTGATAYPPLVGESESRACRFVCESGGFEEVILVDEVSAAVAVLGVRDGVVVDVGGGSTGVGVYRDGRLVSLADRPGGGHHLDLILAGAMGIDVEAAEQLKRESPHEVAGVLRPGLQRIAESVRALSVGAEDLPVHLAGGALMLPTAERVLSTQLGRQVVSYPHALWITPVGIARSAS